MSNSADILTSEQQRAMRRANQSSVEHTLGHRALMLMTLAKDKAYTKVMC